MKLKEKGEKKEREREEIGEKKKDETSYLLTIC